MGGRSIRRPDGAGAGGANGCAAGDLVVGQAVEGGVFGAAWSTQGYRTRPCEATLMVSEPDVPPCDPPVRFRKNVPTTWLSLTLTEGKNRQVRRMIAAVGHPTLRLVRWKIGTLTLSGMKPGEWRELGAAERKKIFSSEK
ncbi:MAG: hypothetical protein LBD30_06875 [Verrucomicrobiales bacterium]|nr:hypothetical protein [Verrucomicrobiales bacterium]